MYYGRDHYGRDSRWAPFKIIVKTKGRFYYYLGEFREKDSLQVTHLFNSCEKKATIARRFITFCVSFIGGWKKIPTKPDFEIKSLLTAELASHRKVAKQILSLNLV